MCIAAPPPGGSRSRPPPSDILIGSCWSGWVMKWIGDAAQIRASHVRKQKTDRRVAGAEAVPGMGRPDRLLGRLSRRSASHCSAVLGSRSDSCLQVGSWLQLRSCRSSAALRMKLHWYRPALLMTWQKSRKMPRHLRKSEGLQFSKSMNIGLGSLKITGTALGCEPRPEVCTAGGVQLGCRIISKTVDVWSQPVGSLRLPC